MKDFSTLSTKYFKLQNRVYFPKSNIHIYMYKVIITASRASKLTHIKLLNNTFTTRCEKHLKTFYLKNKSAYHWSITIHWWTEPGHMQYTQIGPILWCLFENERFLLTKWHKSIQFEYWLNVLDMGHQILQFYCRNKSYAEWPHWHTMLQLSYLIQKK